jgi:benzaldehyde dehydrogenase (NAD)
MTHAATLLDATLWEQTLLGQPPRAGRPVLDVIEPATGSPLTRVTAAVPADVAPIAALAAEAQRAWADTPPRDKATVFQQAAALLMQHLDELGLYNARETGATVMKGQHEVRESAAFCHIAAGMTQQPQGQVLPSVGGRWSLARRVPHGVIALISPFNFPMVLTARVLAPALAAGNAVLIKPDPRTPVSGGLALARVFEAAGLPAGLLQVLPGGAEVGEALVTEPRVAMVSFTGSAGVGRRIGALAGQHLKKVSLELGGSNALIVLDDADVDVAAANAAWGAWLHQGQICMASNRLFVHERLYDAVAERLVAKAARLPVGDGARGQVALGPLIDARQRDRVHSAVQASVAAGARLAAGGEGDGLFYRPTVLTEVRPGMACFDHEVFGPVASLVRFGCDDEAVALANHGDGGLAAGVISPSLARAMAIGRRLRVGMVHINDQTVADEGTNPFGGPGIAGNGNVHGGPGDWETFSTWQWWTVKDQAPMYPF